MGEPKTYARRSSEGVQTLVVQRASRIVRGAPIEIVPPARPARRTTAAKAPTKAPSTKGTHGMQSARNAKPTKPAKLTPTTFLREVARRVALAETGVAGDPEGDALETIASIAKLLGLTGLAATSKDAIVEAVGALFDGGATPRDEDITLTARRYGLTPREVTMCRAKGVDLAKYAARRAAKAGRK